MSKFYWRKPHAFKALKLKRPIEHLFSTGLLYGFAGLLYGRAGFESRPGTPMEIPLLSESDEEIWSGLSECDECVDECITVCLKNVKNK